MLRTLEVNGYRLLKDFKADFGPLTAIVGANACGKSTVLDCLGFVAHVAEGGDRDAFDLHGGWGSVLSASRKQQTLQIGLSFDAHGDLWRLLRENAPCQYSVHLSPGPGGRAKLDRETLQREQSGDVPALVLLENSPRGFFVYDHDKKEPVPFDPPQQNAEAPPVGTSSSGLRIPGESAHPVFRLAQMRYVQKFPPVAFARLLLSWFRVYPAFAVSGASLIRTQLPEIRKELELSPDGSNLGTVLHEVLMAYEHRSVAQEIRDFMKVAYPQIEEITAETAYGGVPARVAVRIRETGLSRAMEISEFSDGMLRFLCLAVALLSPAVSSLVAIDEPEAGLHPKLLPIVGDMIKAASERTQVIVTTHSPDLLDRFSIEDIAVMSREESRVAWERPGSRKALVRMLKSTLGGTVGDLLRSGELEGAAQ